jgi:regulator of RNase E activity RraA
MEKSSSNTILTDRLHGGVILPPILNTKFDQPDPAEVRRIAAAEVPVLSELVGPMYTMDRSIRPLAPMAAAVCGTVITAKCPPGDNLAMIRALGEVRTGDVLIVDAKGFDHWCLGGYRLLEHAQRTSGLAGLIVNGAYRDIEEIEKSGFPVYATGVAAGSGPKTGPGEINVPVCCGGVVVYPGDIVSASGEGIVIIPRWSVASVASAVQTYSSPSEEDIEAFVRSRSAAFDELCQPK